MQTSCECRLNLRGSLPCQYPPCNCEKCQELRAMGKPDQHESVEGDVKNSTLEGGTEEDDVPNNNGTFRTFFPRHILNFHPSNINEALFDIVGIIGFIIMTMFTFWIIVCYYLWHFTLRIYHSGRKAQVFALVLLSLLFLCIVFHAISGHNMKHHHKIKTMDEPKPPIINDTSSISFGNCDSDYCLKNPVTCTEKGCSKTKSPSSISLGSSKYSELEMKSCTSGDCQHSSNAHNEVSHQVQRERGGAVGQKACKGCGKLRGRYSFSSVKDDSEFNSYHGGGCKNKASESLCDLCAKFYKKSSLERKTTISDSEAQRIFQKFRLYGIPTEWKTPPSILVLIMDYLTNFFSGSSPASAEHRVAS